MEDEKLIQEKIDLIESQMQTAEFWADKINSQGKIKELRKLKNKLLGEKAIDAGNAIINILAGAGGDDSEDWSFLLFEMYRKYLEKNNYNIHILHANYNDHGGVRNITMEVNGNEAYGNLKQESGVHRLVRISPFNANDKRHTSFAMVEVLPFSEYDIDLELQKEDLDIITQKSGGPGGQNVNKRETAVRIVHIPSGVSVHVSEERSQEANREKAMSLIKSKLYKLEQEKQQAEKEGRMISKTTEIEWGNQIRNYVMHPYKMVKDLRTGQETTDIDSVLAGDIKAFIEAEKKL
ncbi:MAG: hypothetical protein QG614_536 [Patescibacteria group bacterium]|nr:hypothetical protein [Patescibacteria group bacterium]